MLERFNNNSSHPRERFPRLLCIQSSPANLPMISENPLYTHGLMKHHATCGAHVFVSSIANPSYTLL